MQGAKIQSSMGLGLYQTKVVETLDGGHQVQFTIGVQTFSLEAREVFEGEQWTSKQYAEWYEKCLRHALDNLIKLAQDEAKKV